MYKKILSVVFALIMILSPINVFARGNDYTTNEADEKTTLNIEVKMDNSSTNAPLSLEKDKIRFFFAKNISPGDELSSQIIFKNTEKVPVQVAILDIQDDSALKGDLADEINLDVVMNGDAVYSGPYSKITDPLTNWITVRTDDELVLDLYFNIPLELDNRFQGAKIDAIWNFGVRSNVLNNINTEIIYEDESGKVIKTEKKEFNYDYLVTDKDLSVPDGYKIVKFESKKVTKDGDKIKVVIRKTGEASSDKDKEEHSVTFIYKDKNGNIVKTVTKTIKHGHKIIASDLDNIDGYNNLTFEEKTIEKDDTVEVVVEKIHTKEDVKEKVKTGDETKNYSMYILGLVVVGVIFYVAKNKKLFGNKNKEDKNKKTEK